MASKLTPPTPPHTPLPEREPHPLAYCVEDAALALGVGRTLIFRLIKEGQLQALLIGRRTLISVQELDSFLVRLGAGATNA